MYRNKLNLNIDYIYVTFTNKFFVSTEFYGNFVCNLFIKYNLICLIIKCSYFVIFYYKVKIFKHVFLL